MSLLVVEEGFEGFERGQQPRQARERTPSDTAELFFHDVRVPAENLLGEEGRGFYHLMRNLPQERLTAMGVLHKAQKPIAAPEYSQSAVLRK